MSLRRPDGTARRQRHSAEGDVSTLAACAIHLRPLLFDKPEIKGEGLTKIDLAKQMLLMLREFVSCILNNSRLPLGITQYE
jgi:hypothetical protein